MALDIYFSHIQISLGVFRTDTTSHCGSLRSRALPMSHTWFKFIGFSSFHLYCVRITEWPTNRSSDLCPGKNTDAWGKEGLEDPSNPRKSRSYPWGGPAEALRLQWTMMGMGHQDKARVGQKAFSDQSHLKPEHLDTTVGQAGGCWDAWIKHLEMWVQLGASLFSIHVLSRWYIDVADNFIAVRRIHESMLRAGPWGNTESLDGVPVLKGL